MSGLAPYIPIVILCAVFALFVLVLGFGLSPDEPYAMVRF